MIVLSVKRIRYQLNLSQQDLANVACISMFTVINIEKKKHQVSSRIANKILVAARELGFDVDQLKEMVKSNKGYNEITRLYHERKRDEDIVFIGFHINDKVRREFRRLCDCKGINMSTMIESMLTEYIAENKVNF